MYVKFLKKTHNVRKIPLEFNSSYTLRPSCEPLWVEGTYLLFWLPPDFLISTSVLLEHLISPRLHSNKKKSTMFNSINTATGP